MLRWCARSDKGNVRRNNEDNYCANAEEGIFIVSDGIGGIPGGEVASQIVAEVLFELLISAFQPNEALSAAFSSEKMTSVIQDLNRKLYDKAYATEFEGMGATVVVALYRRPHVLLSHLGDSRAYLFRKGSLTQLTKDHTLARLLVESGQIAKEDPEYHEAKSQLVQYVGMRETVHPECRVVKLERCDRLILCSDGLTNMVTDDELRHICASFESKQGLCDYLITAANNAGGIDNTTIISVENEINEDNG